MNYNSEKIPLTHRSKPWLRFGIVAVLLAAGFWLLNNWDYGALNSFRGSWNMGQGGYGGHMMGSGMGLGMLLFWGLIIFAIVSLLSGLFSKRQDPNQDASQTNDALQILKKRYARGDINKTEFEAMRRDLNS